MEWCHSHASKLRRIGRSYGHPFRGSPGGLFAEQREARKTEVRDALLAELRLARQDEEGGTAR